LWRGNRFVVHFCCHGLIVEGGPWVDGIPFASAVGLFDGEAQIRRSTVLEQDVERTSAVVVTLAPL
jgi:hypothetical protein